jgi:hypothetical protein
MLRLRESFDRVVVRDLLAAFDEIAGDAGDVVVEFCRGPFLADGVPAALQAMRETLRARSGTLWLAAPWPDGRGHTLRPLRDAKADSLRGIHASLDVAVERATDLALDT